MTPSLTLYDIISHALDELMDGEISPDIAFDEEVLQS